MPESVIGGCEMNIIDQYTRQIRQGLWGFQRYIRGEMSFRQWYNSVLIKVSRQALLAKTIGAPSVVKVEPTNICNLRCPLLPCTNDQSGPTRHDGLRQIHTYHCEISHYASIVQLHLGGESFIHPKMIDMIRYAHEKGLYVHVDTNGHYIRTLDKAVEIVRSGLDYISVSVDGATQQTYEIYRKRGNLDHVLLGLDNLKEAKRITGSEKPVVSVQTIVSQHNEHEMIDMLDIANRAEADEMRFQAICTRTPQEREDWQSKTPGLTRDDASIRRVRRIPCEWLWTVAIVWWDGFVTPCTLDENRRYILGNVFEEGSLLAVWNGKTFQEFRQQMVRDKASISICEGCPGDLTPPISELKPPFTLEKLNQISP